MTTQGAIYGLVIAILLLIIFVMGALLLRYSIALESIRDADTDNPEFFKGAARRALRILSW